MCHDGDVPIIIYHYTHKMQQKLKHTVTQETLNYGPDVAILTS